MLDYSGNEWAGHNDAVYTVDVLLNKRAWYKWSIIARPCTDVSLHCPDVCCSYKKPPPCFCWVLPLRVSTVIAVCLSVCPFSTYLWVEKRRGKLKIDLKVIHVKLMNRFGGEKVKGQGHWLNVSLTVCVTVATSCFIERCIVPRLALDVTWARKCIKCTKQRLEIQSWHFIRAA